MGAVGASLVDDAAAVRTAFDGEVDAGHMVVVGNGELGAVGRTADKQRRTAAYVQQLASEGSGFYCEYDCHDPAISSATVRILSIVCLERRTNR